MYVHPSNWETAQYCYTAKLDVLTGPALAPQAGCHTRHGHP